MTTVDAVQATTADGVVLRGELRRGSGKTWLVLVHDAGEDLDVWRPLTDAVTDQGFTFLSLDLRGHGGSDGAADATRAALDVDLGVTLARRAGAKHVAIVAAGSSALAALECVARAVEEPSFALADSLVLVGPAGTAGADRTRLRGEGLATLIISGALSPAARDAETLLRASIGWTVGVTFATEASGSALVAGPFSAHVADKVGSFLREQAVLGGPGLARIQRG